MLGIGQHTTQDGSSTSSLDTRYSNTRPNTVGSSGYTLVWISFFIEVLNIELNTESNIYWIGCNKTTWITLWNRNCLLKYYVQDNWIFNNNMALTTLMAKCYSTSTHEHYAGAYCSCVPLPPHSGSFGWAVRDHKQSTLYRD